MLKPTHFLYFQPVTTNTRLISIAAAAATITTAAVNTTTTPSPLPWEAQYSLQLLQHYANMALLHTFIS
jgi:hypothetical protein